MSRAVTITARTQSVSEKFKRAIRTRIWETLDDAVVFCFRVKAGMEQLQHAVQTAHTDGRHLFANR